MPDVGLLRKALDAEHFVALRTIPGGPALSALEPAIEHSRALLQQDQAWLTERIAAFLHSEERRREMTDGMLAENNAAR